MLHSCQSRGDLDAYLASPACGQVSADSGGAMGCERGALGPVRQAGPAHGSWHGCSLRQQVEKCPSKQWGILMPGDPNWRICVLSKNTSTPSTAMGRDLSTVQRGDPSTLPMALHFLLQREHVVKSDGESYT